MVKKMVRPMGRRSAATSSHSSGFGGSRDSRGSRDGYGSRDGGYDARGSRNDGGDRGARSDRGERSESRYKSEYRKPTGTGYRSSNTGDRAGFGDRAPRADRKVSTDRPSSANRVRRDDARSNDRPSYGDRPSRFDQTSRGDAGRTSENRFAPRGDSRKRTDTWDSRGRKREPYKRDDRAQSRTHVATASQVEQNDFVLGRRAVMEALKGERELNKLLVQENASGGSFSEIIHRAKEQSVVIQTVPRAKLDEITQHGNHQGVVAYVAAKEYVELDELIAIALKKKPALLVMLDGIEDPHNLGSILRSVDAAGASGVIIPKRRAVPLTGTVAKASAGALEHVEVARVTNLSQAIDALKEAGFWLVGADAKAPTFHWQADFTMPTVLVIGNEGEGLARLTAERCDMLVKLPMHGQVDSLNAGVATGILLYEVVRQRARGGY